MSDIVVTLKTLTPLWTGGAKAGKVDRIHETSILGSLRWWYEALVRGLGGYACDPSKGECRFDSEEYEKSRTQDERQRLRDAGLCDVCQVFGATGWRRRFRLTTLDNTMPDSLVSSRVKANRSYTDNKGKTHTPTWYFPGNQSDKPRSGNLSIQIQSLAPDFCPEVIAGIIQVIADWAAIGARAQMGFGVITLESGRINAQSLYDWLVATVGSRRYPDVPSLRNILLGRISPKNGGQFSEQDTFNLKYDLRQLFSGRENSDLRHFIMGTVKNGRIAAKVKMSRPYGGGLMRVWGWIPEEADVYSSSWHRNAVVAAIHDHLSTNYTLKVWREMDSTRDTARPNNGDAQAFLRSLLGLEEEDDAA
ncbi:MAG: type III-B CRISPR module RAMP protein Cmr1 [Candidatus Bipolaricaulaceae bacterium]